MVQPDADTDLVVQRIGHCLVISSDPGFAASFRPSRTVPVEPGRLPVVVSADAVPELSALRPGLLDALGRELPLGPPGRRGALRLLVSDSAGPAGATLAARLSEGLDVDVVAPDGELLLPRPGHLFCAGPAGAWRTFVHGEGVGWDGPRFPAPSWQDGLPPDVRTLRGSRAVSITAVPAGLWLRDAAAPEVDVTDPAYLIPPSRDHLAVVVGRPGEAGPAVDDVCAVVGALPRNVRRHAVLLPYGPDRTSLPMAQSVADQSAHDVLAAHVLPVEVEPECIEFAAVDAAGERTWRPFVAISRYRRGAPPVPWDWTPPLPELGPGHEGVYELGDGWALEVVPAGMLVRPMYGPPHEALRHRRVDPNCIEVLFVESGSVGPMPDGVVRAVRALSERLAPADRRRLRLLACTASLAAQVTQLGADLGLPSGSFVEIDDRSSGQMSGQRSGAVQAAAVEPAPVQAAPVQAAPVRPAPVQAAPPGAAALPATDLDEDYEGEFDEGSPANVAVSTDGRIRLTARPRRAPSPGPDTAPAAPPGRRAGLTTSPVELAALGRSSQAVPVVPRVPSSSATMPPVPVPPVPMPAPRAGIEALGAELRPLPVSDEPDAPSGEAGDGGAVAATGTRPGRHAADERPDEPPAGVDVSAPPAAEPPRPEQAAPEQPPVVQPAWVVEPVEAAIPSAAGADVARAARWRGHRSTADDRQALRRALGWRFDAAAKYVTRLLSERPGLRGTIGDDAAAADLAAVHLFAADDDREFVDAVRADAVPGSQFAFLSCLVAGMQRLPSFTGPVLRGSPAGADTTGRYRVGAEVLEPGPLVAVADLATPVPGPTEVIIWSSTARRLDGLTVDPADARVVFLPGTMFRVVAVDSSGPREQVLLAETPPSAAGSPDPRRQDRVLARLRAAAEQRAGLAGAAADTDDPTGPSWVRSASAFLPGVVPDNPGDAL